VRRGPSRPAGPSRCTPPPPRGGSPPCARPTSGSRVYRLLAEAAGCAGAVGRAPEAASGRGTGPGAPSPGAGTTPLATAAPPRRPGVPLVHEVPRPPRRDVGQATTSTGTPSGSI